MKGRDVTLYLQYRQFERKKSMHAIHIPLGIQHNTRLAFSKFRKYTFEGLLDFQNIKVANVLI